MILKNNSIAENNKGIFENNPVKQFFGKKNLVVWPFMDHKERNPDL